MKKIFLKNAYIVDPSSNFEDIGTIVIQEDKIISLAKKTEFISDPEKDEIIYTWVVIDQCATELDVGLRDVAFLFLESCGEPFDYLIQMGISKERRTRQSAVARGGDREDVD